jgi:hypothetical protein
MPEVEHRFVLFLPNYFYNITDISVSVELHLLLSTALWYPNWTRRIRVVIWRTRLRATLNLTIFLFQNWIFVTINKRYFWYETTLSWTLKSSLRLCTFIQVLKYKGSKRHQNQRVRTTQTICLFVYSENISPRAQSVDFALDICTRYAICSNPFSKQLLLHAKWT